MVKVGIVLARGWGGFFQNANLFKMGQSQIWYRSRDWRGAAATNIGHFTELNKLIARGFSKKKSEI